MMYLTSSLHFQGQVCFNFRFVLPCPVLSQECWRSFHYFLTVRLPIFLTAVNRVVGPAYDARPGYSFGIPKERYVTPKSIYPCWSSTPTSSFQLRIGLAWHPFSTFIEV
ncbi:hypothetical protein FOXYSP1_11074 [Fusarium oxysporum f. sp. phaseoli]